MADFQKAFLITMRHEGGYVNDPSDYGGETYRGISRRYHANWSGWKSIDTAKKRTGFPSSLSRDKTLDRSVQSFYKQQYWNKFNGNKIADQKIACELFDTSVNLGVSRAVLFFQESLNLLNRNATIYDDLLLDGYFGPKSLAALDHYLSTDSAELFLKVMNVFQGMHYIEYMRLAPIQEKYARGWFTRVTI